MRTFFRSGRFKGFLAVFIALLLGVLVAAAVDSRSTPASTVLGTVFAPLQKAAESVARAGSGFAVKFRSSSKYLERIKELESEAEEYKEQLIDYEKTKQKLGTYEEFLEIKEENPDFKFMPAAIIGKDGADVYGSFTLNKGTLDGVSVNNPVIYGKNLVGKVVKAAPTYCVIDTILNPATYVSASEIRTRETGFVSTTPELSSVGQCRLSGLERTTSVSPGGIVCTTGTGGIFPADLIIGKVEEVKNDTADVSSYAVIDPETDFSKLKDVFIITEFRGMGVSE